MKYLKKLANPQLRVKDLLLKTVGGPEPARSVSQLHASDLTKQQPEFCPREFYLHRVLGQKRPDQYVAQAMRVTWDEGRDKQWRINNDYMRGVMFGHWKCIKCAERALWSTYPQENMIKCVKGKHEWEYEEPVFHHPAGFSGSIDGLVRFTPGKIRTLEVKIMKGDDFKDLRAPLAEHRIRTQLYLRAIAESNIPPAASIDTSVGHVLYIMRGHGLKDEMGKVSPFKEYLVERNDAAVDKFIRMATALKDGTPEGVCPTATCIRARGCPVSKACFSGSHTATTFWRAK